MKNVVVFRSDLLPISETFVEAQARALRRWQPVLVGYRRVAGGLPLDGLDVRLAPGLSTIRERIRLRLCQLLGIPHAPTIRVLRETQARLVHVHFGTEAVDLWPSVRKLGLPMVVTLHGYDINTYREWWTSGKGGMRRRWYPSQLLRLAKERNVHFIAVSRTICDRAINFGLPPTKITVCHIGIDVERFREGPIPLTNRPKVILYIGRLVEKKGAEWLIRAFPKVLECIAEAELVIIGEGPRRGMLKGLSESLGVSVSFLGACSSDQVRAQLDRSRVFCLPSVVAENGDAEGLPISILEASACGVPVITSARGSAGESVIDGVTGYCVPEGDPSSLRDRLVDLLGDAELLSKMGHNAARYVNHDFDIGVCTRRLEELYDRVVSAIWR